MRFFKASKHTVKQISALWLRPAVYTLPEQAPTPEYFEQLKLKERIDFPWRRIRFTYQDNHTAALALPCSNARLEELKENDSELLELSSKNIIEHANRRVDLFFYTLIAYYATNAIPVEAHTLLQHGRGRTLGKDENVTQACHSSLVPSFVDQSMKKGKRKSLLSNTHFLESLNSTVELPYFVNAFDDFLEEICRPASMAILRKVSVGKLNPIQGLNRFLNFMNTVLSDLHTQATSKDYASLKYSSLTKHPYVQPKLIDLVIEGTLATTFSTETLMVNREYIELLMRMTLKEKKLCDLSPEKEVEVYIKKMMMLQKEILRPQDNANSNIL